MGILQIFPMILATYVLRKKNYITIAVTSAIHDLKKLAYIKTHDLMQGCKGQFNLRTITTSILILG